MANDLAAEQLSEAYRLAQASLSARVVAELRVTWPLLDVTRLDETAPGWVDASLSILHRSAGSSAALAALYVTRFREMELGGIPLTAIPAALDVAAARTTLAVMGPVATKLLIGQGIPRDQVPDRVFAPMAAAAARHAANAGRDTVTGTVKADRRALGWARVTSGRPCSFCAMLASQGAVYHSDAKSSGGFQPHDGCGCVPEPVYRTSQGLPPAARGFRELYTTSTAGYSGADSAIVFRRAYEGREAPTTWQPSTPVRPARAAA